MDRKKKRKKNFTWCEKACGSRSYAIAFPQKQKGEQRKKKSIWEKSEIEEKTQKIEMEQRWVVCNEQHGLWNMQI